MAPSTKQRAGEQPEDEFVDDPRRVQVEAWRTDQLVRSGLDKAGAHALALRISDDGAGYQVDIHRFAKIVSEGCPPALAAAVLG